MAFIFLGRADEPVEDRFFRLLDLRFGLGLSAEERAKALYEEFGIKDDQLEEVMRTMNMWQEAIEEEREDSLKEGREEGREEGRKEGRKEGLKEGMEMADTEREAAVEAMAAMVRVFMADLGVSPDEAIARVPERYSESVRAALLSSPRSIRRIRRQIFGSSQGLPVSPSILNRSVLGAMASDSVPFLFSVAEYGTNAAVTRPFTIFRHPNPFGRCI